MIVRVLHFGDFHSRNGNFNGKKEAEMVVKALSTMNKADKYIIVFSGDLAFKGVGDEYKQINAFFKGIVKDARFKRTERHVCFFCVPGNHDISYTDSIAKYTTEFEEKYGFPYDQVSDNKDRLDVIYEKYTQSMADFFGFSKSLGLDWKDKSCVTESYECEERSIGIIGINTAPMSLLGGSNADKGLHFLPAKTLDKVLEATDSDYNILVMHHSVEWFNDECKRVIRNALSEKYMILLFGHEHEDVLEERKINKGGAFVSLQSNAMFDPYAKNNGFDVIDLDFDSENIEVYSFIKKEDLYVNEKIVDCPMKKSRHNGIYNTDTFIEYLDKDDNGNGYEETYWFPGMSYEYVDSNNNTTKKDLVSEEELFQLLDEHQQVRISGREKYGKTVLAKKLYKHYLNNHKIPVLVDAQLKECKVGRFIKNAFLDQYDENNNAFERFLQLEKEKRVLIIDDADEFKDKIIKAIISEAKCIFGKIIVFYNDSEMQLNLKDRIIEALDRTACISIHPFYYTARKQLIKKTLEVISPDRDDIDEVANSINNLINAQVRYFDMNPEYILDFVKLYMNNLQYNISNDNAAFSEVFELSLKNRIVKTAGAEKYEGIKNILQEIAYYMHFSRKKEITSNEINDCISKYNRDYRQQFSINSVLSATKQGGILIEQVSNSDGVTRYSFANKYNLAYFVAGAINRKAGNNPDDPDYIDASNNFIYMIDKLCFGINSDIILYLFAITNNTRFISIIINEAEKIFSNQPELDFETENISFINRTSVKIANNVPGEKEKTNRSLAVSKSEKKAIEEDTIQIRDDYDYTEEDALLFSNRMMTSLKLIDIFSKILPAFYDRLKVPVQDKVVELLYRCPNQLLYMSLKDIDDNYEQIVSDLENAATDRGLDSSQVRKALDWISTILVIGTYGFVADRCSNQKTIGALNSFIERDSGITYRLQNLMMKTKPDNIDAFLNASIALDKESKSNIEKLIVRYCVREYLFNHRVRMIGNGEKLLSYFFGDRNKKQKLLENVSHTAKRDKG